MHLYLKRALRGARRSSLVLSTAMLLGAGVGQAYGQAAQLDSLLTSTGTPQVLQLRSEVVPLGNGMHRWSFRLTNPIGNFTRIRFFTAAPNCDLSQISNIQSPPGWTFQLFRSPSETSDAPRINWFVAAGQPGPYSPGTPWLNPVLGQNVKLFSFDLPFGANNQSGRASALNTYGFSGPTLGCRIGDLTITGACPPQHNPSVFRVSFRVRFQTRGNVTITVTRGGRSLSQSLSGITTGEHFLDFNLGEVPATDEIVLVNGVGTENGSTFTASATARITAPIVIVPGMQPTDSQDAVLFSGYPQGLVSFLSGQLAHTQGTTGQTGQIPQGQKPGQFPQVDFICPPIIKVMPFCPTGDPLDQAADMLAQGIQQVRYQAGGAKVHLIGHGGGAILARFYLSQRDQSNSTVRTLSLVSAPNQGSLLAILSPNRNGFERMWPAYPFWRLDIGSGLMSSPQNVLLTQVLGFRAPTGIPTVVVYGTGTETPAIAIGSSTNPYMIQMGSGDGVVLESSATALVGASYVPIPGLKFTNGLSNPAVGQAVLQHILSH